MLPLHSSKVLQWTGSWKKRVENLKWKIPRWSQGLPQFQTTRTHQLESSLARLITFFFFPAKCSFQRLECTYKQNHWFYRWTVLWDSSEQPGRAIHCHYPHIRETHLHSQAKGRISAKRLLGGKGKSKPVHFTSVNMCLAWLLKCWVNTGKRFHFTPGSQAKHTPSLRWK